jgi:hypothetical protein
MTSIQWLYDRFADGAVLAAIFLAGISGLTPSKPAQAADLPSAMACTFLDGGAWSYEKSTFASKPVAKFLFTVRDIDRATMTAKLERKDGLAALRMVQAVDALHFIEVGVEGYLNLTTIYEKQATGEHPAVHSRHVAVLGEPLVSQYRGTCQVQK